MDNYEAELEKFLNWFAALEQIPGETRIDFLNHMIEVGYMDEKAEQFIADTLDDLARTSREEADELKHRLDLLNSCIEGQEDPELSLAEAVLHDAEEKMSGMADELKSEFATTQKEIANEAESAEAQVADAEIEKVRKDLN